VLSFDERRKELMAGRQFSDVALIVPMAAALLKRRMIAINLEIKGSLRRVGARENLTRRLVISRVNVCQRYI